MYIKFIHLSLIVFLLPLIFIGPINFGLSFTQEPFNRFPKAHAGIKLIFFLIRTLSTWSLAVLLWPSVISCILRRLPAFQPQPFKFNFFSVPCISMLWLLPQESDLSFNSVPGHIRFVCCCVRRTSDFLNFCPAFCRLRSLPAAESPDPVTPFVHFFLASVNSTSFDPFLLAFSQPIHISFCLSVCLSLSEIILPFPSMSRHGF